jgi:hypothetical protein
MARIRPSLLIVLVTTLVLCSSGSAQQTSGTRRDSTGDLGLTVRQDDLDSFWLDTNNWYWYGYRPYTKVHLSRYAPGLPTWNTPGAGYSFGINEGAGNEPWEGGPKVPFQLTKHGTWH